jgi:hypothetical protein
MVRPCVARGFRRAVGFAVLHQCIRPLIGAFAPGHHGYLGGGTSPRGLCRRRRSWRGTSKASGPLLAASSPRRLSEFAELRAVWCPIVAKTAIPTRMADIAIRFWDLRARSQDQKLFPHVSPGSTLVAAIARLAGLCPAGDALRWIKAVCSKLKVGGSPDS